MSYEITRLLRRSPLSELGPISWRAAELIENLTEEITRLRQEAQILKKQIADVKVNHEN